MPKVKTKESPKHYYNEFNPHAAQWLRNLMDVGLIPKGFVDERSISDVEPDDLRNYTQCHFFAGIGGWSLALRQANWPEDRAVWTGSCPCQPFSTAGKRGGFDDERHLWPEFYRLISECAPPVVFGEQVASKDGLGWYDGVRTDLEASNYAVGCADLCAAGVGAPHVRQRLFWVGHAPNGGYPTGANASRKTGRGTTESAVYGPNGARGWSNYEWIPFRDGKRRRIEPGLDPLVDGVPFRLADGRTKPGTSRSHLLHGLGNAIVPQVGYEFIVAFLEQGEQVALG